MPPRLVPNPTEKYNNNLSYYSYNNTACNPFDIIIIWLPISSGIPSFWLAIFGINTILMALYCFCQLLLCPYSVPVGIKNFDLTDTCNAGVCARACVHVITV